MVRILLLFQILVSPIISGLVVTIGVPILLAYVYGVVPISLCRSEGCGVSTSGNGGVKIDVNEDDDDPPYQKTTNGMFLFKCSKTELTGFSSEIGTKLRDWAVG